MYAFARSVKKADHVRRFSIRPAEAGWEVREEQDSQVIRQCSYQDWHRVEHARRAFVLELSQLREDGWQEFRDQGPGVGDQDRT